jgi:hypothetical protein
VSNQCDHGHLRRSCEICQRDEEIERLKAERDALLGILKDALSHVEWSEKIIYPFVGEDFQSWRLTVFLGVPLSESDKSPEAALERTISAAIDAARGE